MKYSRWFCIPAIIFALALFAMETHAALPTPVAHWSFNDGTTQDVVGDFDGEATTASSRNPNDCAVGKCFEFGTSDEIKIPSPSGDALDTGNQISVSAWFSANDTVTERSIIHRGSAYGLFVKNNEVEFFVFTSSWQSAKTSIGINADTWYHVVGTYDGTNIKIFIQGDPTPSGQTPQTNVIQATSNTTLIGKGRLGNPFLGKIDEVKVYNVALSPSQVMEDYLSGSAGEKCKPSLNNCLRGTACDSETARCVPKADNREIGTWCSRSAHCDTKEGFFKLTCDTDLDICVGAGNGVSCEDDAVNTNLLFGKLEDDVPVTDRCDPQLFCARDEGGLPTECKRGFGTEFVEDLGLGDTTDDIRDQLRRVINIVLGFLGIGGVIIVIYGGGVWMTALGEEEKVEKGKKTIIAGIIGLIIIGIAWTIVSYILNVTLNISQ